TRCSSATWSRRRRSTTRRRKPRSCSEPQARMAVAQTMGAGRTAGAAVPVRPRLPFARRRRLFLLLFGAPAVLYVIAVAIWPLLQGLSYSFYDYNLLRPSAKTFVGLENYRALFTDAVARNSIVTTLTFTVAAVTVEF